MLNSYELNGAALNGRVLRVVFATGLALATAGAIGDEHVTRYTPGDATAIATLNGTAYPIYPQSGSASAWANASASITYALRHGAGQALATANGVGFMESEVFASGGATATATLVGIPANDIGKGDAFATAALVALGNRVKFNTGNLTATAEAVNSTFDVVRYVAGKSWAYATATAEAGVNDVLDASGIEAKAVANGEAEALVFALSAGHGDCSSSATGYGNIVKRSKGQVLAVANLAEVDSFMAVGALGDMYAYAEAEADAVRIVIAGGGAIGRALHFANARARKKAYAIVSAKATATADLYRYTYDGGAIEALAIASGDAVRNVLASSYITAEAFAVGKELINPFTYAPFNRTVIVQAYSPRIVIVRPELREIRVTA